MASRRTAPEMFLLRNAREVRRPPIISCPRSLPCSCLGGSHGGGGGGGEGFFLPRLWLRGDKARVLCCVLVWWGFHCGGGEGFSCNHQESVEPSLTNLVNGRAALPVVNRQKAPAAADKCRKPIKQRNENNKAKPEVIVISSDSEKQKKSPAQRAASLRAPIQTLTSILTKCSRASGGVISPKKELIYDIDASDAHNELAVIDYVEDIYRFYRSTENTYRPLCTYMVSQTEINERMRAILTDWLIEVHYRLMLMPETLYLTVYIIDQYLSLENVARNELQLVGVSAMLIACKYEETWAPLVKDFLVISDNSFSRQQVLSTEKSILNKLQWNLTVPTMYMFILRYLKAALGDKELEHMTFFYAELALVQYSMLFFAPSVIAAAAVYAARCTLGPCPEPTMERSSGVPHRLSEPQLLYVFFFMT
uniref:Cyclin N-terminal domain-containing protein n=1 Tax=Oryza barthii TaxID=65489 RepID=A0A0D3F7U8_9ORYZ